MAINNLFRTPFGLLSVAFAIIVVGFAVAGLLLNIPVFVIITGIVLVTALAFWWVTRARTPAANSAPTTSQKSDVSTPPAAPKTAQKH